MSSIIMEGPVAYLGESHSTVFFSQGNVSAGTYGSKKSTALPVRKMQTSLEVAVWGEDNRFPQNVEHQMAYCSIGKETLKRRVSKLMGGGIRMGKVVDYNPDGSEVFQIAKPNEHGDARAFMRQRSMPRFWLEYLTDWVWFANCAPEIVLSKDAKTITGLVHQESCDFRFKQMNTDGNLDTIYLSKLWGAAADQYARFDPTKAIRGLIENQQWIYDLDNVFIKQLSAIDMYDPVESLTNIAEKLLSARGLSGFKSAILPVNYPSVNKTYYQVPAWDGCRLAGWVEIASKVPALIKALFNKAYKIKYHIEVPETYFNRVYGLEKWTMMTMEEQKGCRKKLVKEMNDFLIGVENAYSTFISFFDVDPRTREEYGLLKITPIDDKSNMDKELVTSSSANVEIMMAMGEHPSTMSAGGTGSMYRSGGGSGSDIREAGLDSKSLLFLERQVLLEPLYLVRDFNQWDPELEFRIVDTVLTTLDQGKGTKKVVS